MIIRVDHDLMCSLLGLQTAPGSFIGREKDLSHLLPYSPDWLRKFAHGGSAIMVITRDEYRELDYEIAEHVDVLKP